MARRANGYDIYASTGGGYQCIMTISGADDLPPRCVTLRAAVITLNAYPCMTEIRAFDKLTTEAQHYHVIGAFPDLNMLKEL